MPRRIRVEEIGFYHVINRGVERRDVFLCDDDRNRFLEVIDESAGLHHFVMYAWCLMDNHYHFLLETKDKNLSRLMRQINSKYSIYFNRKYERVGPLWQGRFKSWYVYDEAYLFSLLKYIESNPVRAGLTERVGDFPFASSYFLKHSRKSAPMMMRCFDPSLLKQLDSAVGLLGRREEVFCEKDAENLSALHKAKFEKQDRQVIRLRKKALDDYGLLDCDKPTRNRRIVKAVMDGYRQSELAAYLGVSSVLLSKVMRQYRAKIRLFEKYKKKGLFWSYSRSVMFEDVGDEGLCEVVLKYGDFEDLKLGVELFGLKKMKQVWLDRQADDQRFIPLNLFIARVLFSMDLESDYFRNKPSQRHEKLRLLAG